MKAILHDGTELEFPDGTDPAVVQATVKKVLGQQAAPPAKQPGIMDSISNFNSSVANGLTGGFYDELIKVPIQTGVDKVFDLFGAPNKPTTEQKERQRYEPMDSRGWLGACVAGRLGDAHPLAGRTWVNFFNLFVLEHLHEDTRG